jgi:hypothetical protein
MMHIEDENNYMRAACGYITGLVHQKILLQNEYRNPGFALIRRLRAQSS